MDEMRRNPKHKLDDLTSEFDEQSDVERKRMVLNRTKKPSNPARNEAKAVFEEESARLHARISRMSKLTAYERHKEIINLYYLSFPGSTSMLRRNDSHDRTDYDVLKDNHKFLWTEADASSTSTDWESRMAKKYYDKLFKEYCIVDLTYYKENKVAMRWRVEKEVKSGKGQFVCGNKRCEEMDNLTSWEVNFAYKENGERKSALVKCRLCHKCSEKLNFKTKKRRVDKIRKKPTSKREKLEEKDSESASEDRREVSPTATSTTKNEAMNIWEKPVEVETTANEDVDAFLDELFF